MSAPAAAPHRTISQFCDHVCMYVRFRPDHEAITAELTAHLEDHKDAILEIHPDMTLWEAERRAVEAMGNPEELGRWLDSIHNPLLGWLQIWFVRA
ncbi:permease prefix domain 1-containing protein, partial [Flavonifractor sp.]